MPSVVSVDAGSGRGGTSLMAMALDGALQREGHALDAPYLYFTVVALDGIADLFSARTRLLGLLDEEQQRLARALQIRWELTQAYWAAIASFGFRSTRRGAVGSLSQPARVNVARQSATTLRRKIETRITLSFVVRSEKNQRPRGVQSVCLV